MIINKSGHELLQRRLGLMIWNTNMKKTYQVGQQLIINGLLVEVVSVATPTEFASIGMAQRIHVQLIKKYIEVAA